jgi:zinc protease
MGATLSAGANSDYTTIAASSLTTFHEQIFDLLADIALNPSFPENEVKLIKENTKESLKQQRAQPSFLASEMVSRIIFGEHPYSNIAPTLESLDGITRQKIVDFHQARFAPNNAVLVVAGDVDADSLIKRAEGLFGAWQARELQPDRFPQPPKRTSRSAYLVDRPGSAQSNIVIANGGGITRTSPNYFPMLLMHTVLGANASSRLFMNLREEKGYTYGAYSSLDARRTAGSFRVSAEVRTPVTGASLKEFFFELDRIRTEPVSAKELDDAKSYLTGVFPIRLETQEGLIEQIVQIKMLGLPDDYLQTYREEIQDVRVDDVQRVANEYIRPDEAAVVVVGDGAEIKQQVKPFAETAETYNTSGELVG